MTTSEKSENRIVTFGHTRALQSTVPNHYRSNKLANKFHRYLLSRVL